jgi:broad-specificity NMP kinase
MRHLVQYKSTRRRQVFIGKSTVHELVVIPGIDHAELAKFAAAHDRAHLAYRRVEAMGMSAEELDTMLLRRVVHSLGVVQTQRHRLFDDDVLLVLRRDDRMLRVQFRRRGDIDGVDIGALAELFDAVVGFGVEIGAEAIEGGGALRIRGGRQA